MDVRASLVVQWITCCKALRKLDCTQNNESRSNFLQDGLQWAFEIGESLQQHADSLNTLTLIPNRDIDQPFDASVAYPRLDILKEFTTLRGMSAPSIFLLGKPSAPVKDNIRREPYPAVGDVLPPNLQNMTIIMRPEYTPTTRGVESALLDWPPLREDRKTTNQLKIFHVDFRGLDHDKRLPDFWDVQWGYLKTGCSFTYELNLQVYDGCDSGKLPRVRVNLVGTDGSR